jgi:hypothetical protein
MVVDDVIALLWPENGWDHVSAEEFVLLLFGKFMPAAALLLYLTHPDSDLGWTQPLDGDGFEHGIRTSSHGRLLPSVKKVIGNLHQSRGVSAPSA